MFHINGYCGIEFSQKNIVAVKKARLSCLLRAIFILVSVLILHLGYWIQLNEHATSELKPILAVTKIFSIIFWLFIATSFFPGFFLCAQMSCNLMKSTEEIFLDSLKTKVMLKNTVRFIKRTKRVSKLLSPIYFHLSLCAFVPLTGRMYQLIHNGLGLSTHHLLLSIGMFSEILGLGFGMFWMLNTQSEDLRQHFKEIKEKIRDLVTCKDSLVEINGMEHDEEYARKIVIEMLDEFHGFDANGFFTLSKPFLVNVLATAAISYALLLTEFHIAKELDDEINPEP